MKTPIAIYFSLNLPALIVAFWSFKIKDVMSKRIGVKQDKQNKEIAYSGILEHSIGAPEFNMQWVMETSVCGLGTLGGIMIFSWFILSFLLMIYLYNEEGFWLGVFITDIVLIFIVMGLSLCLNLPLFFRSIPFYYFHFIIILFLCNTWLTIKDRNAYMENN